MHYKELRPVVETGDTLRRLEQYVKKKKREIR